jgi:hypothetical protein
MSPMAITAQRTVEDGPPEIPLNATIRPGHALQDDGLGTYLNGTDDQEIYLNHRTGTTRPCSHWW